MINRFANTFFFGYLTKSKRLVRSVITIGILLFLYIIFEEFDNDHYREQSILIFFFWIVSHFFMSFVMQPFSSNPKNEIWIVIVWAILTVLVGVIIGD